MPLRDMVQLESRRHSTHGSRGYFGGGDPAPQLALTHYEAGIPQCVWGGANTTIQIQSQASGKLFFIKTGRRWCMDSEGRTDDRTPENGGPG